MADEAKDPIIFERRKFIRVDGTFVVNYTDMSVAQPKSDVTQTRNISVGGIMFTTDKHFPEGTILKLKIRLPSSSEYINAKAKVVGSGKKAKGILCETRTRFISIKEEDRDKIKKIIEHHLQKRGWE